MIGRFPPENIPFASYLKNLVDNLEEECEVVTIGLRESDCDYVLNVNKNFTKELENIVQKEKLDILHIQYIASSDYFAQNSRFSVKNYVNTIRATLKLSKVMKKLKIPKVTTLHELNIYSENMKQSMVRWLEQKIISKSDIILVHSNRQKKILTNRKINVESVRFGLIPVNLEKKVGKNLLYLATIYPSRGVEYLIRAMKFLPDYNLVIKGPIMDEAYAQLLKDEIKNNDLKNVSLGFDWGNKKDRDKLYRKANIVVLPYLWAPNQSAALHDAFSYKTPVVVTNTNGPIDETVKEFGCGVVVEKKDPQMLAEGVQEVYKNYKKYMKGIEDYRKISNWRSVAESHIKIYKKLLKVSN